MLRTDIKFVKIISLTAKVGNIQTNVLKLRNIYLDKVKMEIFEKHFRQFSNSFQVFSLHDVNNVISNIDLCRFHKIKMPSPLIRFCVVTFKLPTSSEEKLFIKFVTISTNKCTNPKYE